MSAHITKAAQRAMVTALNTVIDNTVVSVDVEVRLVARNAAGAMIAQQPDPTVYSIAIGSFPVTLDIGSPPMHVAVYPVSAEG